MKAQRTMDTVSIDYMGAVDTNAGRCVQAALLSSAVMMQRNRDNRLGSSKRPL